MFYLYSCESGRRNLPCSCQKSKAQTVAFMKSKSTFSILFYLRLDRKNNNGAPLMMRVTINGKTSKMSLGVRVHPKNWDGMSAGWFSSKHKECKQINVKSLADISALSCRVTEREVLEIFLVNT